MNFRIYRYAISVFICLTTAFSCTNNRPLPGESGKASAQDTIRYPVNDTSSVPGSPSSEVLFRHSFKKEPSDVYQVVLEKKNKVDSGLYALLYKDNTEVHRQSLNMSYYWLVKKGRLSKTIPDTGIDHVDELAILSFREDNDDENAAGESSESVEESTVTMLFGKSGDKLIEEIFTESSYYFSYDGELNEAFDTDEDFVFPSDEGGIKNHIILKTNKRYLLRKDDQDSCREEYSVSRKLYFSNNEFVNKDFQVKRKRIKDSDAVPVYGFPAVCSDFHIGKLQPGAETEVLERSENETEILTPEEEKSTGRWVKISFKSDYGNTGYILEHHLD